MSEGCISRGFRGRRTRPEGGDRLPPGQYLVDGFPVLSAGPAPHTPLEEWDFSIVGEVDEPKKWTWEEFRQLPSERLDGLQPSHRPGDARGDRPFPRAASARLRLRSTPLVEAVATVLVELGHEPARVKTERFGPTGG